MNVRETRRAATLDRIADHILAHGLAPSSLRALAVAAGTSDRMLLYYFADKDDIVTAALQAIAFRMAAILEEVAPSGASMDTGAALREMAALTRSAALRPYMRVWLELVVLSARDEQPYKTVAGLIADGFIAWVGSRLAIADDAVRAATAARLVATIDGLVLLDCVGRGPMADLALDPGAIPG